MNRDYCRSVSRNIRCRSSWQNGSIPVRINFSCVFGGQRLHAILLSAPFALDSNAESSPPCFLTGVSLRLKPIGFIDITGAPLDQAHSPRLSWQGSPLPVAAVDQPIDPIHFLFGSRSMGNATDILTEERLQAWCDQVPSFIRATVIIP